MRGYSREYDDPQRFLSGGSTQHRDRWRHNPSWEGRGGGYGGSRGGYDFGAGYGGSRSQWGDAYRGGGYGGSQGGGDWRRRTYTAGYGGDYNDYGQGDYTYGDFSRQYPADTRRGGYGGSGFGQGRGMQRGGMRGGGMGRGGDYGGDDPYRGGMLDTGIGGMRPRGSFANPTSRGDYFLGYGGSTRRGYSPFW